MNDRRLDTLLDRVARRAWPGPDRNDRVDRFLKEQTMPSSKPRVFARPGIAIAAIAILCGGAVTAAVTHQVITGRAVFTAEDGTRYEIEIVPLGEPATGTFTTDDGAVYHVRMPNEDRSADAGEAAEGVEPHVHIEPDADED